MKSSFARLCLALSLVALAAMTSLPGCGSDGDNPAAPNPGGAVAEVAAGNQALAAGDYAAANAHYRAALALDPNNREANFGAAVTEVYVLQLDPEVAGIIDFVQGRAPRAMRAPIATSAKPRDGRAVLLAAMNGLRLDPEAGGRAVMGMFRMTAEDPILISDIQQAIKLKLMPRLLFAEARINQLEAFPDLNIVLTPAMTGEPDPIEIDHGDILMLDAALKGLQGWLGMVVAYDFDGAEAEPANAESLLTSGTDFGTLHTDGALQLASARSNLLLVNSRLDAAAASIAAETDDQADDAIPAEALNGPDFAETMQGVDDLTASLNGSISVPVTDYQGGDSQIDIDLSKFFTNVITDLKTKLPNHTFVNGEPVVDDPITLPDPTMNLIFPNMTNTKWQQLLGPPTPIAARIRW